MFNCNFSFRPFFSNKQNIKLILTNYSNFFTLENDKSNQYIVQKKNNKKINQGVFIRQ